MLQCPDGFDSIFKKMTEDKIIQIEQKNKELEANIQALSVVNAQNMTMQFQTDDENAKKLVQDFKPYNF